MINKDHIAADKRLQKQLEAAQSDYEYLSIELAKHRYWAIRDAENPDTVSVREYAKAVGKGESAIRYMVDAYAYWLVNECSWSEAQGAVRFMPDERAAAKAVAEAHGITVGTLNSGGNSILRDGRKTGVVRHQVKEVAAEASRRAAAAGSSVTDEVQEVAEEIAAAARLKWRDQKRKEQQKKSPSQAAYEKIHNHLRMSLAELRQATSGIIGQQLTERRIATLFEDLEQIAFVTDELQKIISSDHIGVWDWDADLQHLVAQMPEGR